MERTLPFPAWASSVYSNSRWTNLSPFLSLSLFIVLFESFAQNSWILSADTTKLFSRYKRAKSRGIPLRKHASAQVMEFRYGSLGSCNLAANNYRHWHSLHRVYQKVAVLQASFFLFSFFQWLEQSKARKRSTWEILSALWAIDSCALGQQSS